MSRKSYPKQFLELIGDRSLFQQSCERLADPVFTAPIILCNNDHRFIVAEQMQQIGVKPNAIVLEPAGRNTAPAALIAALTVASEDKNKLLLLLPSDHVIPDKKSFVATIGKGCEAARQGKFITFGIQPDHPNTSFGYIRTKDADGDVLDVSGFVEKPTEERAEAYIKAGSYHWNAGIVLFSASDMIEAFAEHKPDMLLQCREALEKAKVDLDFLRLDTVAYEQCENISLDYAIMEKANNIGCVLLTTKWSDLGSWTAIAEQLEKDDDYNAAQGDVLFHNSRNCFGHSQDGACLTVNGLDDVIIVATKDAILVTSKSTSQSVKQIVEKLKSKNRKIVEYHTRVYRPWGWYEALERGERFQVKCLMVKPGEKLSLQSHHHRAEHWVVVSGTARVKVDEKVYLLTENESAYIPIGATHRLENPGQIPTFLIEVQSGSYLGEDDIVRYEDIYGRDKGLQIL